MKTSVHALKQSTCHVALHALRALASRVLVALLAWAVVQAHGQTGDANGVQWIESATLRASAASPDNALPVRLSDAWNGVDRSGTWVYEATFSGPDKPEPWGLYIPRIGNRAHLTLNGLVVGQLGALSMDTSDYAQRPHFFFLPETAMKPSGNTLQIVVQGERARYAGLSSFAVGPVTPVQRMYFWRDLAQTQGSFAIVTIASLFTVASGALAGALRDRTFLLFALACFFCAIRTMYALAINTHPLDYRIWSWIVDTSFAGYLVTLSLFCLNVIKLHRRWVVGVTVVLVALTLVLVPMHAFGRLTWARQLWTMSMVIYSMLFSAALVYQWWRSPSTATRVLGVAGLLAVSLGLHDHLLVFYTQDGFGSFALTRYSLLLFMGAMLWVLVNRFAHQQKRESSIRQQLQAELEAKTSALVTQFKSQAQLIESMAHAKERERLVHDLHDGIGLQLNTLLYMAEDRTDTRSDMLQEVRTAIEQMRLLVDSSQRFEGSFPELLGQVRHRIESRLSRLGIQLQWHVHVPQTAARVDPSKAIAFQHLLFELTTNVIKHAKARCMRIELASSSSDHHIRLTVSDDGIGFDPAHTKGGGGSRSIQRRLRDLEAPDEAVWDTSSQGCQVSMEFPPLDADASAN